MIYFLDNSFIDSSRASLNIMSPSVQYGLNVFEGIRGYYNNETKSLNIVELDSHIFRLLESARFLALNHKYNFESIRQSILDTVIENKIDYDIYLRVVLLFTQPGSWITGDTATLLIAPMPSIKFDTNKLALSAKVSSWERISGRSMPPRIKAGANYLNSRLAQQEVKLSGYDMAIFLNSSGFISEAPGSCIFMIKDRVIYTPTLTSSILGSITRLIVIQIVTEILGVKVIESNLERVDLYQADEVFLCGTAIEITPLKSIDHIVYGDNDLTRIIMEKYQKFIMGELELNSSKIFKI
jgi:branched-chain amino acid aminotransferase